jgi:signal transduction histidine kinase
VSAEREELPKSHLSEGTSDLLSRMIPEVMNRWEERAKKEISATYGRTSLVLRDALPQFLGSIVILLSTHKRTAFQIDIDAAEIIASAKEHGRGRAGMIAYVMSQVIAEYQQLRQTVFEVLEEQQILANSDRDIILAAFESATNTAATEFALALSEAQEQFLLSIAHDLRTPIAAAHAGAELILRSKRPEVSSVVAGKLKSQMQKMTEMIENILDTSRIRAGESLTFPLGECDLEEMIRGVLSDLKLIYGDWFVLASEGPVIGMWNTEYLRRMIENLAVNAVKYRAPETPVTITLCQSPESATIEVHNLGNPISPENQGELFKPFRRIKTTEARKGWGLGLALVKGIVDAFGGSVSVESTAEKGTTFTVVLPKKAKAEETVRLAG